MTNIVRSKYDVSSGAQLDYLLLDTSGSMADKWRDTCLALDTYVATVMNSTLNSHVVLTTFSDAPCMVQRDVALRDWIPLSKTPIAPDFGGTAFYDALSSSCQHLMELDPERCSFVAFTDGEECDSKYTDFAQAASIVDYMRARGWQVTFFGCDFNNSKLAKRLGMDESQAIGVQRKLMSPAAASLAKKRIVYGHSGEDIAFNSDEKQQFGGYLAAPERS